MRSRSANLVVIVALAGGLVGVARAHPGHTADDAAVGAPAPSPADPALVTVAESLERRLTERPDEPATLARLAMVRLDIARQTGRHDDFDDAISAFDAWLGQSPGSVEAGVGRTHALLGRHRFAEALRTAQDAVLAGGGDAAARAALADAHLASGNYAEATLLAASLADESLTLESLARVGVIAWERGRLAEAALAIDEALQAGTLLEAPARSLAWCWTLRGDIARDAGDADGAEAAYARAVSLDPLAHEAEHGLARLAARRGELDAAVTRLTTLVQRFGHSRDEVALAAVLARRGGPGDAGRAASLFDHAEGVLRQEIASGHFDHGRQLVNLWLTRGTDASSAARLAVRELEEDRRDAEAYELAAFALHRAGRDAEAADLARRAVALSGERPRALLRCGLVMHAAGETSTARAWLSAGMERALALDEPELLHAAQAALSSLASAR